jgi:hypothetical protein
VDIFVREHGHFCPVPIEELRETRETINTPTIKLDPNSLAFVVLSLRLGEESNPARINQPRRPPKAARRRSKPLQGRRTVDWTFRAPQGPRRAHRLPEVNFDG